MKKPACAIAIATVTVFLNAAAGPLGAQGLPALTDEVLRQTGAALHVDVQTGRVAGITPSGPVAEGGAKIVDVLFGDHSAGEWISYSQRVEGEYVKPAVSQRLLLFRRDDRGTLLDADFSPAARDALVRHARYWHPDVFGRVASRLYIAWCAGALTLPILAGWLYDRAQGYGTAVMVAGAVNVIGVIVAIGLPRRQERPGQRDTAEVR